MTDAAGYSSPLPLMTHGLARNWWLVLLRGLAGILFGVLTFLWPGVTVLTLMLLLGVYTLADGVFSLLAAIMGGVPGSRWWLAVVGIAGIVAGLAILSWPGLTAALLLLYVALWAIATGIMEIVGAIRMRKEIRNEWLLIAAGILSVLFGVIIFMRPGTGALALLVVIAAYAIVNGILLVGLSLRLRHRHKKTSAAAHA